jgi:hypothetical protein
VLAEFLEHGKSHCVSRISREHHFTFIRILGKVLLAPSLLAKIGPTQLFWDEFGAFEVEPIRSAPTLFSAGIFEKYKNAPGYGG